MATSFATSAEASTKRVIVEVGKAMSIDSDVSSLINASMIVETDRPQYNYHYKASADRIGTLSSI